MRRRHNHYDARSAFDACASALVNSTVAVECGRFYDRDIMLPLDVCIKGQAGICRGTVYSLLGTFLLRFSTYF